MEDRVFTTAQVASIIRVPLRKVISFVERDYVAPSVQDAAGHGSKRLWNYNDLIRCEAIVFLLDQLSVDYIRCIAADLAKDEIITKDWVWLLPLVQNPWPFTSRDFAFFRVQKSQDCVFAPGEPGERKFMELLSYPALLILDFESLHENVETKLRDF